MLPVALRAQFPVLERVAYLNAGSNGPLPAAAAAAGRAALEVQAGDGRSADHFAARGAGAARLREAYAALLGCDPGHVALTTSTSDGLGRVIAGLGLEPGSEVLTAEREHPGLIGPLLAARDRGVRVRTGPLSTLADHVTQDTTVVACSHVGWVTGEVADPRLGDAGVPLVLDGAQGVGAVDVDVAALGCLAYAGSGQKWLCGADGTGMLYLSAEGLERVRPLQPAYGAFRDAAAGLDGEFYDDARAFDAPALSREGIHTSLAALGVLERFGWAELRARAGALAAALASELAARGRTVGPRGDTTLVAWEDPDPPALAERLAGEGIVIRHLPATPYVRAAVGAWNDETDLQRLLEAL